MNGPLLLTRRPTGPVPEADALAPAFGYLLPFIAVAFVLALLIRRIPLSDTAGTVARGEAGAGEEAERMQAEPVRPGCPHGISP